MTELEKYIIGAVDHFGVATVDARFKAWPIQKTIDTVMVWYQKEYNQDEAISILVEILRRYGCANLKTT